MKNWNNAPKYKIRRRIAAGLGLAAIGGGIATGVELSGGSDKPATTQVKDYTTKPGDTEWSIASRAFPQMDPRLAAQIIDKAADKAAGADIQPNNVPAYLQLELPANSELGTLATPRPSITETSSPQDRGGAVKPSPTPSH